MRRLLWLIVCLMTMVLSSCSKEDESNEYARMISGTWECSNLQYEFKNGNLTISTTLGSVSAGKYYVNGNNLVFSMKVTYDDGNADYYKRKIDSVEQELKTARGSRKQYLIDQLNTLYSKYRNAKSNQRKQMVEVGYEIISLTQNVMIIRNGNETMNFKRIKK